MEKRNRYLILSLLILIIGFIFADICFNGIAYIDKINFIYLRNDLITKMMLFITNMGSTIMMIILGIGCLLIINNKIISIFITSNLISISLVSGIIKNIVKRSRPEFALIKQNGYSYPSGHSLISITFYGLLIYFISISNISNKLKNIFTICLSVLILLIGFSRIYLGVHYPSDVISGLIMGIIYLILVIPLFNKINNS